MAIVNLDRQQGFALIAEMTSTRNLLAYGIRVLRAGAFIETTRDPIMTMLSIGVEKLYKLTLGLAALDHDHKWPSAAETKAWRHRLVAMHEAVLTELHSRTVDKSLYVCELVAEVEADPVVPPLVEALDTYGRMGRFYYLDQLGGCPQPWMSPDAAWQQIQSAALADPAVAATYSDATVDIGNNEAWDRFIGALNERIATAIEQVWIMIAVCGRNHALGETGRTFGFEVHPDAVGRQ
ncbi:hypothetical protein [Micromonospora sp. WMMD1274]|uniref:hypothetical protein n=1 Tax=Micromonospora sp. WMMD1274 TaxID=3404116 RepID=UPI0013BB12E9|nr:hypothetical protein [Micromonospora aurantiaca]